MALTCTAERRNHSSLLIGQSYKISNHAVAWGSEPRTITSTRTKVLPPPPPTYTFAASYQCITLSPAHAQTCIYTPRITSHGATFPTHSSRKDPRTFIPKGAAPYLYKSPLILSGNRFCYCMKASTNYGSQLICVAAGLLRARKERYGILQSIYISTIQVSNE